jgi:hypothetical protein
MKIRRSTTSRPRGRSACALLLRNKIALDSAFTRPNRQRLHALFRLALTFLVLLTAGPHPFEIEKHCSKADRKFDYKTNVAIRQWVGSPVRKRKEKSSSCKPTSPRCLPIQRENAIFGSRNSSHFEKKFLGRVPQIAVNQMPLPPVMPQERFKTQFVRRGYQDAYDPQASLQSNRIAPASSFLVRRPLSLTLLPLRLGKADWGL